MRGNGSGSTGCLSEGRLIAWTADDAGPAEREHVRECRACAGRLALVQAELGVIVTALRAQGSPLGRLVRPGRRGMWVGATAAAALALAVLGGSRARPPVSLPPGPIDHRAFLEVVSRSMFAAQDYDRWLHGPRAQGFDTGGSCAWGSLAMPCYVATWTAGDEPGSVGSEK